MTLIGFEPFIRDWWGQQGTDWSTCDLKIGIDAGVGLSHYAAGMPQSLFVGIELKPDKCVDATARLESRQFRNAVVVNSEAIEFLESCTRSAVPVQFDTVHVNFPTPFPNAINLKTILVTRHFANLVFKILRPGGNFRLVTDDKDYFLKASSCFSADRWRGITWQPLPLSVRGDERYLVGTPCEKQYKDAGKVIYFTQLMKLG